MRSNRATKKGVYAQRGLIDETLVITGDARTLTETPFPEATDADRRARNAAIDGYNPSGGRPPSTSARCQPGTQVRGMLADQTLHGLRAPFANLKAGEVLINAPHVTALGVHAGDSLQVYVGPSSA